MELENFDTLAAISIRKQSIQIMNWLLSTNGWNAGCGQDRGYAAANYRNLLRDLMEYGLTERKNPFIQK